jgi:hypothetical protein
LAITLDVDGRGVIVDAGTGLYTPDPQLRNQLRSAKSHSAIVVPDREPNDWLPGRWGLFAMNDRSHGQVIAVDDSGIEAQHEGFGVRVQRRLRVGDSNVEIIDTIPPGLPRAISQFVLSPEATCEIAAGECRISIPGSSLEVTLCTRGGRFESRPGIVSPAYGVVRNTKVVFTASRSISIDVRVRGS